jgi:uncharacterized damage-inducible protein DinB
MLPAAKALIAEIDREVHATRRVLERVPAEQFGWRPHPKSFTAGQLAHHVATIPGGVARFASSDGLDVQRRGQDYATAVSTSALLTVLDESVEAAREFLAGLDESRASAAFRVSAGDRELFTIPRLEILRTMGLNHWYHHRGELVVYLRLLDVPVPVVYGRSADESSF